jgi:SulP family sulfate permease
MPALAALLIVAGFQGLRMQQAVMVWKTSQISKLVMLVTFIATLIVPLQFAVLFGVALSILLNTIRQSNKVVVTQWVLREQGFPLEQPPPARLPDRQLTVLQIYGSLFFAAAKSIEALLPAVGDATRAVVAINLRGETDIGSTFVTVLQRYSQELRSRQGRLMLVGVDPLVREQLAKTGALALIGDENVFVATPQLGEALNRAVAAAEAWMSQSPDVPVPGKD